MKKGTITYGELGDILTERLNKLIKQEEQKEKTKRKNKNKDTKNK